MRLTIPDAIVDELKKKIKNPIVIEYSGWRGLTLEHTSLKPVELETLKDITAKHATKANREASTLARKLKQLEAVGKGKPTGQLEVLAEYMRKRIKETPRQWVFIDDISEAPSPYLITAIDYHPPHGNWDNYQPAHVSVQCQAFRRGHHQGASRSIYKHDIPTGGLDADGGFAKIGWTPATDEAIAEYEADMETYLEYRESGAVGTVYVGVGDAEKKKDDDDDSWWGRDKVVKLDRDGIPDKLIIDDEHGWGSDEIDITVRAEMKDDDEYDEDSPTKTNVVKLPEHPYLRLFDLRLHCYVETHVRNVQPYVFDRNAFGKVVLSDAIKNLIDALVSGKHEGDDVVAGKGKGIIFLSSGPPGVGKTLTAETYAERAKRGLYVVQCAQLGIDPEEVEKNLAVVLHRTKRWGCILLIDEADVFIRERGSDLVQNAIVGVFLRLLEYFEGVLFMTTNREGDVDDAILSRCIAHIPYKLPSAEERATLWNLMSEQFKLDIKVPELVKEFPTVSGRTIKQLCRLAKTMEERGRKPDLDTFRWLASFQDIKPVEQ